MTSAADRCAACGDAFGWTAATKWIDGMRFHDQCWPSKIASPSPIPRSDADYAIEFGEYLATAADDFMAAVNHRDAAIRLSDFGAEQVADAALTDHWKALQVAVYEFRKRAARAGHDPSAVKFNR